MRKRRKRRPITSVFIACEGKNTEPIYFERIKEEIEENNQFAVTIYPERSNVQHKSDPIGLITEAQSRITDFDEVWVVYDKNGYTKHKEAVEKANESINGKIVNIAFSSIAFEQWVLLHFEQSLQSYPKSKDLIEDKFISNTAYFPTYSKQSNADIYPYIKENTSIAIKNASWLRHQLKTQLLTQKKHTLNPYTDVDFLVKKLFGINKSILFSFFGESLDLDNLLIETDVKNRIVSFTVFNQQTTAVVLNAIRFYKIESGIKTPTLLKNQVINPSESCTIKIEVNLETTQLMIEYSNYEVFFV